MNLFYSYYFICVHGYGGVQLVGIGFQLLPCGFQNQTQVTGLVENTFTIPLAHF